MIKWTGPDKGILRKALLEFYPSVRSLKRFVSDNFEHSLTDIADSSLEDWAEDLLSKAVTEGWISELYKKFCSEHQTDLRIAQLRKELKDPDLEVAIGDGSQNAIVRAREEAEISEDPRSTHLVVAVFWQERSKQKFRIRPKLCYRDPEGINIIQEPLVKDDCAVVLKDVPNLLKKLVSFTIQRLENFFPDPVHPWQLTVELFVPVDLLCQPLSAWCGQDDTLLRSRPIIMGCSDRFDPDRPGEAADLHNQLKQGWQRFQKAVPDRSGSTLQELSWLDSDQASQTSFARYSGFRCYGDWLKRDEQFLNNWIKLVRSGIPLALWMGEGSLQSEEIANVFDRLTAGTRFDLLTQIPTVRDELQERNHCVGVWYEDPNYVPDIPISKDEQFFEWPGSG
jgi:vWA-MoxR associated protein C-terminal domain/Effector-associated domain 1